MRTTHQIISRVGIQIWNQTLKQTSDIVFYQVYSLVKSLIYDKINDQVWAQTRKHLDDTQK